MLSRTSDRLRPTEVMAELERCGVVVSREGDHLRVRAPRGALTPALRALVSEHKRALLALLAGPGEHERGDGPIIEPTAEPEAGGEPEAELAHRTGPLPALRGAVVPLSPAQRQLWLLARLDPASYAYNIAVTVRIRGVLDVAALAAAVDGVVRRHESLRLVIDEQDGEPAGVVRPPLGLGLVAEPLQGIAYPDQGDRDPIDELCRREAETPFDGACGPAAGHTRASLLRVRLFRLDHAEHVLCVTAHHLVLDGWSIRVLMRDLGAHYAALAAGRAPLLPPALQHAEYVAARQARVSEAEKRAELDYWLERLAGAPALLALPVDRPRPAPPEVPSDRGARLSRQLPEPLAHGLTGLCRAAAVTPFMALLALLKLCLGRLCGETDVVVGTPVAGRDMKGASELVGMCVDTLLVRTSLAGDPRFCELLERVKQSALGVFAHSSVALEEIAAARAARGERAPVVQVMLNLVSMPPPVLALPGLDTCVVETLPGARADLTLYAYTGPAEPGGGVRLELAYRTELFDPARMAEFLAQLEHLLAQAVADPERRLGGFSLVTREAAPRLPALRSPASRVPEPAAPELCELAGPREPLVPPVFERLLWHATHSPERVAMRDGAGTWTYAELAKLSAAVAAHLAGCGVGTGDAVAIYAHRSAALVIAVAGVLRAGAALVILDPEHPPHRLAAAARMATPRAWIRLCAAGPLPAELAELAAAGTVRARLAVPAEPRPGDLSRLSRDTAGERAASLAAVEAPARELAAAETAWAELGAGGGAGGIAGGIDRDTVTLPTVVADDVAYIAFTSGTTGAPRGVIGTHGPLLRFIAWHLGRFDLGAGERVAMLSGLSHDPLLRDIFTPLAAGAMLCIPAGEIRRDPASLRAWLAAEAVTVAHLTPPLGRMLASSAPAAGSLVSLRYLFFAGDVLAWDLVDEMRSVAPNAVCVNFYGATETPQAVSYAVAAAAERVPGAAVPLGRGIDGADILVLTARDALAGVGELGRIAVRGPCLARGYLNGDGDGEIRFAMLGDPAAPDASRARGAPGAPDQRVFITGDLGRYRPDGAIELVGRCSAVCKIRGYRIALAEVEAAVLAHPAVVQAVVVAREHGGETELAAYVVMRDRDGLPEGVADEAHWARTLRAFAATRLPAHMIPAHVLVMDVLPLTANGKIDRAALPAPRIAPGAVWSAPRTELEAELVHIFAEVLGYLHRSPDPAPAIGIHDDLFALGGHSLSAARILSRVRELAGVDVPMRRLFAAPTVAGLAATIDQALAGHGGHPVSLRPLPASAPSMSPSPSPPPSMASSPAAAGRHPTSFAQERLWFVDRLSRLSRLSSGDPGYRVVQLVEIAGPLDRSALDRSLVAIERRHEILRTSYQSVDGEPVQVVTPARDRILTVHDRAHHAAGTAASAHAGAAVRALTAELAARPLCLERGPIWRADLIAVSAGRHILCVCIHHIACDGWSMGVMRAEVAALYQAFCSGAPDPLPPLPIQYSDYAAWQRQLDLDGVFAEQLAYWRRALAGLEPLELPAPAPRPPVPQSAGAFHRQPVSAELVAALHAVSRAHGVTLFMTLLAGFKAVLWRYTGSPDIAVGAPMSHRPHPATEALVGLFLNVVVLRDRIDGRGSFADLLGQIRDTVLGAHAHRDVPFERVVEALAPVRDRSVSPLFQVLFNMLDVGAGDLCLPGLECRRLPEPAVFAKFELTLHATWRGEALELVFVYRSELLADVQIRAMAGHLLEILGAAARAPGRPIAELRLTPAALPPPLPARLCGTPRPGFEPFCPDSDEAGATIVSRFARVVERHRDRIAVATADGRLITYGRLAELASAAARLIAASLPASAFTSGPARVGLFFGKDELMVAGMLGALAAGAAYVPLDPAFPADRLAIIAADAELSAIATCAAEMTRAGQIAPPGVAVVDITDAGTAAAARGALRPVRPDDPAYLLYTSGSTGTPKGVVQSHRNVLGHMRAYVNRVLIDTDDRLSLLSTYAFDAAVMDIYGALLQGARLCLVDLGLGLGHGAAGSNGLRSLGRAIRDHGITILHATPTVYRYLLESLGEDEILAHVRRVVLGGEEVLARDVRKSFAHMARECVVINGLGPTESTLALQYAMDRTTPLERPSVPVGYPVDGMEVVLENQAGPQVAIYGTGEIIVRGPHVALGYWRRPELSAAAFPEATAETAPAATTSTAATTAATPRVRSYRTGDWGRLLPDGSIEFAGRRDQQVKIRGHRVELGEIEAHLEAHAHVARAAVVEHRPAGASEPRLIAFVVASVPVPAGNSRAADPAGHAEQWPGEAELRAHLATRLPVWMLPSALVPVAALPATPTGKLDRRALLREADNLASSRAQHPLRADHEHRTAPARDALENQLLGLWEDVLGVRPIGIHDDFFALGGHSLLAVRLLDRVHRRLGCDLPLASLFQGATVAHLAEQLRALHADPRARPPERMSTTGDVLVVPLQAGHEPALVCVLPPGARAELHLGALARALRACWAGAIIGVQLPAFAMDQGPDASPSTAPASVEDAAACAAVAVRAVIASGSYVLCGYSHGGILAHAMTEHLAATGEPAEKLLLIDSPAPPHIVSQAAGPAPPDRSDRSDRSDRAWMTSIAAHLVRARAAALAPDCARLLRDELAGATAALELDQLTARARRAGVIAADTTPDEVARAFAEYRRQRQANARVIAAYQPIAGTTAMVLFRARVRAAPAPGADPTLGWGHLGPVEVHDVPGDHESMLDEPDVHALAAAIARIMAGCAPR